jgi:hypothetical protein
MYLLIIKVMFFYISLQLGMGYLNCDDLLVADPRVDTQRHLVFATE